MSTYDNGPPLDGWCCQPHRECPCMDKPTPTPVESHLILGTE